MEVIAATNIHKSFKIYHDKGTTLKERMLFQNRNWYEKREVLKGIDLSVEKGSVLGLIGENGSGKSTLLKLLTKIIYPDRGTIRLSGKVSSLLELGAGFHPDMSGRENIYTNASIFGLSRKEIDQRLQTIIAFSELDHMIENPVRTYSSGMYMRLAFSVAINVDADILLIDEILSVGDASFQAKCFDRLQQLKQKGTTIVIVSHDLGSIERLCNKACWLHNGEIIATGPPHDVAADYLNHVMAHKSGSETVPEGTTDGHSHSMPSEESSAEGAERTGNGAVKVRDIQLLDPVTEKPKEVFNTEDGCLIQIRYEKTDASLGEAVAGFGIFRNDGVNCYGSNTMLDRYQGQKTISLQKEGVIQIRIHKWQLLEGRYTLDIALHDENGLPYDYLRRIKQIQIFSAIKDTGVFRMDHQYETQDINRWSKGP